MQSDAACLVRPLPHYRQEAFVAGLEACGFKVSFRQKSDPAPGDLLLIWNRYGHFDLLARIYESRGASVIVAENGYIGDARRVPGANYDGKDWRLFALALSHHNGAGRAGPFAAPRFLEQGIELKPWRKSGEHILVLPQRGIGPKGVAMPEDWAAGVMRRLADRTRRPIRLRPHPGKERPPLEPDLENCWACVTWGSGAAIKAIAAGVPVFHEFPFWIGKTCARFGLDELEDPLCSDALRENLFARISWAQWTIKDIASGAAFRALLELAGQRTAA